MITAFVLDTRLKSFKFSIHLFRISPGDELRRLIALHQPFMSCGIFYQVSKDHCLADVKFLDIVEYNIDVSLVRTQLREVEKTANRFVSLLRSTAFA